MRRFKRSRLNLLKKLYGYSSATEQSAFDHMTSKEDPNKQYWDIWDISDVLFVDNHRPSNIKWTDLTFTLTNWLSGVIHISYSLVRYKQSKAPVDVSIENNFKKTERGLAEMPSDPMFKMYRNGTIVKEGRLRIHPNECSIMNIRLPGFDLQFEKPYPKLKLYIGCFACVKSDRGKATRHYLSAEVRYLDSSSDIPQRKARSLDYMDNSDEISFDLNEPVDNLALDGTTGGIVLPPRGV